MLAIMTASPAILKDAPPDKSFPSLSNVGFEGGDILFNFATVYGGYRASRSGSIQLGMALMYVRRCEKVRIP